MDERAGGLDQSLEKQVVLGVLVQPNLLQDIMRFVVALLVPALEIGAIIGMIDDVDLVRVGHFANEVADET